MPLLENVSGFVKNSVPHSVQPTTFFLQAECPVADRHNAHARKCFGFYEKLGASFRAADNFFSASQASCFETA